MKKIRSITKTIRVSEPAWDEFLVSIEIKKELMQLATLPVSQALNEAIGLYNKKYNKKD